MARKTFSTNGIDSSVRVIVENGKIIGFQIFEREQDFFVTLERSNSKLKRWNTFLKRATTNIIYEDFDEYISLVRSLTYPFDRYIVKSAEKSFFGTVK